MSFMSEKELRQLKDKAVEYCGTSYTHCKWLYRNHSSEYFEDIKVNDDGLMKTILKDDSGDPRSPINDRVDGGVFHGKTRERGASSNITVWTQTFTGTVIYII